MRGLHYAENSGVGAWRTNLEAVSPHPWQEQGEKNEDARSMHDEEGVDTLIARLETMDRLNEARRATSSTSTVGFMEWI